MHRQQFRDSKFGRLVAPMVVNATGKAEQVGPAGIDPVFTGAPVEIFQEFVKAGKTDMDIPVGLRLTGSPVHGDVPLKGKAERSRVAWRTVKINETRKAWDEATGMSLQIIKQYADSFVFKGNLALRQWLNDYWPGNILLTVYAGSSRDLVVPTAAGGRAVAYVAHPNFYTADAGEVGYSGGRPGVAGYEAAVEAALNNLTNTTSDHFTVALIRNLVVEAGRKKIQRIMTKDGFDFYPIFITEAQWVQLQNDPEFKDWMKRLPVELTKHPLATGAQAYVHGAAIIPDNSLWCAYTNADDSNVTAGTVEYGPRPTTVERAAGIKVGNWIGVFDSGNKSLAILVGKSMMSVNIGKKIGFTDEVDDHEHIKELGINFIESASRADIYDLDGQVDGLTAGQFYENTSSLVCATYSPYALTWGS
jgi:hypothetical protein